MEATTEFMDSIRQTSQRILSALSGSETGEKSAWDLKIELKVQNAVLYLALGELLQAGQIQMSPHGATYRVRRHAPAPVPSES